MHVWQQPIEEAEQLISGLCPEGGVVCDPMCGSGTTLAAALKLGRQVIGADLDQDAVPLRKSDWPKSWRSWKEIPRPSANSCPTQNHANPMSNDEPTIPEARTTKAAHLPLSPMAIAPMTQPLRTREITRLRRLSAMSAGYPLFARCHRTFRFQPGRYPKSFASSCWRSRLQLAATWRSLHFQCWRHRPCDRQSPQDRLKVNLE